MPAVAQRQVAQQMHDQWARGLNYWRRMRMRDPLTGDVIDLSDYPTLVFGLEGQQGGTGTGLYMAVRYDEDRGGALQGAVNVIILADGLDLDRVGTAGFVRYSIGAKRFGIEDLPLIECRIRVKESAFR